MRRIYLAWATLVIVATHSPPASSFKKWIDSGRKCSCSGNMITSRTLNCTNRGRSTLTIKELCWLTRKVDLSYNHFKSLPESWGSYIKEVNVSHNILTAIPRVPPLNLKTKVLDLSNNKIAITSHELRILSSLKTLVVSNNQLSSLTFLPSPCALLELSAHHNAISSFHGPLNGCSKMEHLDLSFNRLIRLPRGAFSGLHKLKILKLNGAKLFYIAPGAFEGLKYLQYLDLSDNSLGTLPSGVLYLQELKNLLLDRNNISFLPADVLHGLRSVELISLTSNKLLKLKYGLFAGLHELKRILLDANYIRYLPFGIFSGLHKVEYIGLSSNKVEVLPSTIFAGLHKLKNITLGNNLLTNIPSQLLLGISYLHTLDLTYNRLTSLPYNLFLGVKSINNLVLFGNYFTDMKNIDFTGLESIGRLDLRYNQIRSLPQHRRSWPKMKETFISGNNITELSEPVLHSWLGDLGREERYLDLGQKPPLSQQSLKSFRSVLGDPTAVAEAATWNCACGYVKRGKGVVAFCIKVSCPDTVRSWVHAARALGLDSEINKSEPQPRIIMGRLHGWITRWTN